MGKVNRRAYESMIAEDLEWLESVPRTLERDHVIVIVRRSAEHEYDTRAERAEQDAKEWLQLYQAEQDKRETAEQERDTALARVRALEGALRPFAEAWERFDNMAANRVYAVLAAMLDFGDWERAHEALRAADRTSPLATAEASAARCRDSVARARDFLARTEKPAALQAGAPGADIGEPASGPTCLSCGRLPGYCEPYCGAAPAAQGEARSKASSAVDGPRSPSTIESSSVPRVPVSAPRPERTKPKNAAHAAKEA